MQFGTALMSFILFLFLFSLILFGIVYTPSRELLWEVSRDFMLTLLFSILFKEFLVYFIFVRWQCEEREKGGERREMKNIQSYSILFCILLIFNVLYGILSSIFRMLIFIGFSFVAILRIDATMLPDELSSYDQGYYSFHSYLMFEV